MIARADRPRRPHAEPWRALPPVALAVALAALPARTRGDSLALRLEGNYGSSDTTNTDAAGSSSTFHAQSFQDDVRASLSKTLYESLVLSGTGLLDEVRSRTESGGSTSTATTRNWAAGGRLDFGANLLRGGVSYDRRQTSADTSTSLFGGETLSATSPTLISDSVAGTLTWQPIGLLPLALRVTRTSEHDTDRARRDNVSTSATADTSFAPTPQIDGSAAVGWSESEDRLNGSSTASWTGRGSVRYGGKLGRGTLYVSDGISTSASNTRASGPGGNVVTHQLAAAGLALVEALPATPTQSALKPLPALVDGNITDPAGVNLGTSTAGRGDVARRHLGLQFPDALTPVNTLWVWVDRQLPTLIAAQLVWTAFQSDDNLNWTPLPITAPVVFGAFENRFEITIPTTRARYVKVVTAPLLPPATTDPRFADIQVTELQALDVVPATSVLGWNGSWGNSFTGGLTMPLTPGRELQYDLSLTLGLRGAPLSNAWFLTNGLGWQRQLSPTLGLSARAQRADNGGTGVAGAAQTTWGAMLNAQPLPTLTGSLGYSGAVTQRPAATIVDNGLTGAVTAALYEGVSASASSGVGVSVSRGRVTRSAQGSGSTTIAPSSTLSFSGAYSIAASESSSTAPAAVVGTLPSSSTWSDALTGSVTWAPVPALTLSSSATRIRARKESPHELAAFQIAYSPFRGGSLVLALGHGETFDYQSSSTTKTSNASITWRLTSWANLIAGYVLGESEAPLGSSTTNALNARLTLTL